MPGARPCARCSTARSTGVRLARALHARRRVAVEQGQAGPGQDDRRCRAQAEARVSELLDRAAIAWWDWMAPMAWQVALLALVAAAFDRLTRRRAWPELRHALWMIVIVRLAVPPSWSSSL